MTERVSRQQLLERLLEKKGISLGKSDAIQRRSRTEEAPLSFSQERLWFIDRLEGTSAYHISQALELSGELSAAGLAQTLSEIIRRHEVLRTVIRERDGKPMQRIVPPVAFRLPVVDLTGLTKAPGRQAEVKRLSQAMDRRPFDLSRDLMLRSVLVRSAPQTHSVLATLHHIAGDGWSLGILRREVGELYGWFSTGSPSGLPELPVQYGDYAAWQRKRLSGARLHELVDWWSNHLAGAPAVLELPTDRPRPPVRSARGGVVRRVLPEPVPQQAGELVRRAETTPFVLILAAFGLVLSRLSGLRDLTVGTPIAGRDHSEVEDLIGFFVNTLVVRLDLSGNPSFRELLARVRAATLDAQAHQELPFSKLVEELAPARSLAHSPLFQVLLTVDNTPRSGATVRGLAMGRIEIPQTTTQFDLSLAAHLSGGALRWSLSFAHDLFDPSTARRLLSHLERLFTAAVSNPELPLLHLPMLTEAESHQVVTEWNDTVRSYDLGESLVDHLTAQIARAPDRTAVVFGRQHVSYAELARRVDRVARKLRASGVAAGSRVGICADRSVELVMGLLAVQRAGAAYVPLDPSYPEDRLAFMQGEALGREGGGVCLVQRGLEPESQAPLVQKLTLEDLVRGAGGVGSEPLPRPSPDAPVYVIYTSGSTGRPKGVINAHRGVVNRLLWMQETYRLGADDRVLQKTPFSFDVSVWEFFWPLMTGACLVVARPEGHKDSTYLARLVREEEVTTLHFVPSMLRAFLEDPRLETGHSLRRIILSGEALSRDLEQEALRRLRAPLFNLYGPTEAAIDVTWWPCEPSQDTRPVPIGRPVANTRILVLDRQHRAVPIGVAGELCIAGVQIARGYLHRPALTADRFTANPLPSRSGERVYRTGDLVRWLPRGEIEFLGRLDHQVKLRGLRIELGEIESALVEQDRVRECVVVMREETGDPRLVAYVVGEAEEARLREDLAERLPAYMVPSAFVVMESLPLTPNGKVDRRALPEPSWSSGAEASESPEGPVEELVAGVWAEVLGLESVEATESFFDLGGHSLLATRVVSRVRDVMGVEVGVRELFEHPTVRSFAAVVDELRRQDILLEAPPLEPVDRTGDLPLSFAQQRLWFLDRLEPGRSTYNIPQAVRVSGGLRAGMLETALSEVVRRHEVLRTRFAEVDGEAVQVIDDVRREPLRRVDLTGLPAAERSDELRRLSGREARRPFDLSRDRMVRGTVVELGWAEHGVLLTLHHIAGDGWSMERLFGELSTLYRAFAAGRPSPLVPLPVQYADYAVWQRSWLAGHVLERELSWWRRELADLPPVLELPTDRPRRVLGRRRGGLVSALWPNALTRDLRDLGRRRGATPFMTLLAGFEALLARWTGSVRFAVGTPIAGRTRLEVENLIGFFVNTLALRGDLTGEVTFDELLRRVRETALSAHAHQELPFERLVEELAPERSLTHTPLFQVVFAVEDGPRRQASENLGGLRVKGLGGEGQLEAKFDLSLFVTAREGAWTATLSYSKDLFDETTMRRLLGHLERLLALVSSQAEVSIWQVPLLTAGERQQTLVEWNDTAVAYPSQAGLAELFAAQAERTPDAVAVEYGATNLTYGEVRRRANAMAHRLRDAGVSVGSRVGVCLERSPAMVVTLVGVLEAGGAYVPLDPEYPVERLAWMVEDAVLAAGVSQSSLRPVVESLDGTSWLEVDRLLGESSEKAPERRVSGAHLAYVIYTSGSTGKPKGVGVPQEAVTRLVWETSYVDLGPGDRLGQASTVSFDAATFEIWGALLTGSCLVGVPREISLSPRALTDHLKERSVTTLFLTTALFNQVAAEVPRGFQPLRSVLFGGEAVDPGRVRQVLAAGGPERLLHVYGPTENTTFSTWHPVEAVPPDAGTVPIGRAISNTGLSVLDASWRPVSVGSVGELCLTGPGLARGYLGRPGRTARNFIPDPLGSASGARTYCTGDLVRWLSGGVIEFLGRRDHQVKVRGFRIELGEIESALAEQEHVRGCVVVLWEESGDKRMVAYVAGELEETALREDLAERLPAYMVPSAFVVLESLPLTPNGKVDRKALPAPQWSSGAESSEVPEGPVEELVAGVWSEVLGLESVGATQGFFDLGGHSLLATRVVSRVRDVVGVDVGVRELFEHPTVRSFASVVEDLRRDETLVEGPPLEPVDRDRDLPLSFAQQRLWFLDRLEPGRSTYNIPQAVRVYGGLRAGVLEAALSEVVRRHEALRTRFAEVDGEAVQVIDDVRREPLRRVDLTGLPAVKRDRELRRLAGREARRPFDLARDRMVRATIVHLEPSEHSVFLTLHHIAGDGWSMGLLLGELNALYRACAAGRPSPLEPLPVQYADYAVWQRGWLAGEVLERELSWWREELSDLPPVLDLPTDRPRQALGRRRGGSVSAVWPKSLAAGLRELSRRRGATRFMTLLAGFETVLARWTGSARFAVGTPIAGRTRLETENLIGFFVNTLVLRGDLTGDLSFEDLQEQVRESVLSAHAHQELPFERLVEELAPERSLTHTPLFQVMFSVEPARRERAQDELGGLRLEGLGGTSEIGAKFDLSLFVTERNGGLVANLSYVRDLFDESTMRRWLHHLETFLTGAVESPELPVHRLPLMPPGERHQVLWEHDEGGTLALAEPVHLAVEERARQYPDAVAVRGPGDSVLTYGELETRANRWARHLRSLGVGPEEVVAVLLDRSPEEVISLLAVLKAEGAYLPMDPSHPADRLGRMVADAGARVLLTSGAWPGAQPETTARRLWIENEHDVVQRRSPRPPVSGVLPDHPAYVIFTSGSTGRPKGVVIPHRGLSHLVRWHHRAFDVGPRSRAPRGAGLAFDASVWELWPYLSAGASVHLPDEAIRRDPRRTRRWWAQEELTVGFLSTPMAEAVLAEPTPSLPALERLLTGGDRLHHYPSQTSFEVVNNYGPTENTVVATSGVVTSDRDVEGAAGSRPPDIGRPIPGVRLRCVDLHLQPVPLGIPGEMVLGGAGLARGYSGRPGRTAVSFRPDPLATFPGSRIYRTGDLGRRRPDGRIDFLGRIDRQVQLRGQRVELGEIETALVELAEVAEAVVILQEPDAGAARLVAYVVIRGRETSPASLASRLRDRLPPAMVPTAFVRLDSLPLTPNGKVDRKALPEPPRSSETGTSEAPEGLIEELVAGVWSKVLGLDAVGVAESFFALGGHSLLATRVVSRVRDVVGVDVGVRELFEHPTVRSFASVVEDLRRREARVEAPPLVPVDRDRNPPLSFGQQRLWFLDRLEPGRSTYNIPQAVRVSGGLRAGVLEAALGEVVRRHEVLRTRFAEVEGEAVQMVDPTSWEPLRRVDLTGLPAFIREGELRRLAGEEAHRPFDLSRDRMVRGTVVGLEPTEHGVFLTLHHIAGDGWSMSRLFGELSELYRVFATGQPSPYEPLPIQYADYAVWQRSWLTGEVLERELSWWRGELSDLPPVLDLPTDRPRQALAERSGGSVSTVWPKSLAASLRDLARRRGATPFMTLLSGFEALLARWTGSLRFAVGTPIAGRTRLEVENLIGFFVNTLVLRGDLTGEPTFEELLGRVRETALTAHAHQELPFERLVEELAPQRSLTHTPLFQVLFSMEDIRRERGSEELAGLRVQGLGTDGELNAKFDLSLFVTERGDGMAVHLSYARDLFDETTMLRLLGHLERLVEGAVSEPDRSIRELALFAPGQRQQMLVEWTDTSAAYPSGTGLAALFERQVARTPDAVAVEYGSTALSYGELDRRANAVAYHLMDAGVRVGSQVGVCLERSVGMVVALLGVLKAGGAYVPLDPEYPAERLAWMVEDASLAAVVSQTSLGSVVESVGRTSWLDLDALLGESSPEAPQLDVSGDHLAYVIYTSGSTGRPKGVGVPQRAVTRLVWETNYVDLGPGERLGQISTASFDAATFEIWGALLTGGCLVGVPREVALSPRELADHLSRHSVTAMFLTVALFNQVAATVPNGFDSMRYLLVGGEAVDPGRARQILAAGGPEHLLNGYGPTENTTFSTWYRIREMSPEARTVPLGRAISNTALSVLDGSQRPVPVGVVGELCLTGDGLARGYLGRPGRTARSFIPDPLGSAPGARAYRTGDLARWLPRGEMEFLGRRDHQVKVRGFRIELGEIESVLAERPGVEQCVVVVHAAEASEDKRLVAYVVGGAEERTLREDLADRLPPYMVPSTFVFLEALPLSPNGKVDRGALPEPSWSSEAGASEAPEGPVEELVAGVWSDVLGARDVGATEDFFDLGGHSLLATRVVSRVRDVVGVDVGVRELFEHPTVRGFAQVVERMRRDETLLEAPPLVPVARDRELPLSFAQQRLWFLDRLEPGRSTYNIPQAVRVYGGLRAGVLEAALSEVVRRHEVLRTRFAEAHGEAMQVIDPPFREHLRRVDLTGIATSEQDDELQRLAGQEARRPFDLSRDRMVRGTVVVLGSEEHGVLSTLHHIAGDGWSMERLFGELSTLYRVFASGRPSPLAPLPVQYADYAVWQRSWLAGEVLERELAWWHEELGDLPPVLELPTDRPRPAVRSGRGGSVSAVWPNPLGKGLGELGRRRGATLFMTLLAGFEAVLGRWTGNFRFAVGTPIAGRTRLEVEDLIGFFVNTLVLRGDLTGAPTFEQLLLRVRKTALAAHAHQELPFERLVEELTPERNLAHTPLFQVMFSVEDSRLQNPTEELGGLHLRGVRRGGEVASKFDVSLFVEGRNDALAPTLTYDRDLFDETTMLRLLGHLRQLLEAVLERPERSISEISVLTSGERQQALREWNDTQVGGATEESLIDLFTRHARETPDAVAVAVGGAALSYGKLDQQSEAVARDLAEHGVRVGSRVGVCLERSIELLTSLLGVLKAGAVYVPLDPSHPAERLSRTVEDAGVTVGITQPSLRSALDSRSGTSWRNVQAIIEATVEHPMEPPRRRVSGDHPAYVIYTSGSTGRPKGTAVRHGSVVNLLRALERAVVGDLGRSPRPLRVAINASQTFDASVKQWGQWVHGRTLLPVPEAVRLEGEAFLSWLLDLRPDVLDVTPSQLEILVRAGFLEPAYRGRPARLLVGGEALREDLWHRLAAMDDMSSFNVYGPTETTVDVTVQAVGKGRQRLGRPLANVRTYVTDAEGRELPPGIPGELRVGGAGLAVGYVGRPGRTAGQFVPDAFGPVSGARLYRTGDLVRWLPRGEIEFLGRLDHQVKLRGLRIELGEIESALAEQDRVRECVVVMREETGDPRLVAYVVGEAEEARLREDLAERLPAYMVPSAFVVLESLPLTPNGKVDRRALPEPSWSSGAEASESPEGPVEELVAGVWAEVLGLDAVGVTESFFDLGGHSLLATRVVSRVRDVVGIEVGVRELFEHPTVRSFASVVEDLRRDETLVEAPPLEPVDRDRDLPLSFAQQRLWFLDRMEPDRSTYNMPHAVEVAGARPTVLAQALSEIVRRHEVLRTSYPRRDGEAVQAIHDAAVETVAVVDLTGLSEPARGREARRLEVVEAGRAFRLDTGPVLRSRFLRSGVGQQRLLLTLHHIAGDGWSMGIVGSELRSLYEAFVEGRPSDLEELPVQYVDYAGWQRHWLRGDTLQREVSWWRRRLADLPSVLELPTDRPRPGMRQGSGGTVSRSLSPAVSASLRELSRRRGATLFMTLLAGFEALLGRWTGRRKFAVGAPMAGRVRLELEPLIGLFVNMLALRVDLTGEPSFEELLVRVRETTLAAHAHQELPFEKLVEELSPERSVSHTPLFQVTFSLDVEEAGADDGRAADGGLPPGIAADSDTAAKFDLSLFGRLQGDRISLSLSFARDVFDRTTALRLLAFQERLLEEAVAAPDRLLSELPVLSRAQRQQMLVEWNDSQGPFPRGQTLADRFERAASRAPDAMAIAFEDRMLTYGELERRTRRGAEALLRLGVGPDVRVGICAERSLDLVIAVLAVLRAGGAYVPLDPAYPEERLALMIEDAGLELLVIQRSLRQHIDPDRIPIRLPEELWGPGEEPEDHLADRPRSADALAYILFTSGSTGRPKGVGCAHAGVLSLLADFQSRRPIGAGHRASFWTSLGFDVSVYEIFSALLFGATLEIVPDRVRAEGPAFAAWLEERSVESAYVPPFLLADLERSVSGAVARPPLRRLLVGVEPIPESRLASIARGLPGLLVLNGYGPTETTVCSTLYTVDPERAGDGKTPLGRPLRNDRMYLVDGRARPVLPGALGEVWIQGSGLARGYVDRSVETAEAFVPDPWRTGERAYRTGDLARWLPDGNLEFVGRVDHQVKLRGFRIEPGEIESPLRRHPRVEDCVVVLRKEEGVGARLVAYLVSREPLDTTALREGLRDRLPAHMIPAAFVVLDALPLTPSGKLDRQALPMPEWRGTAEHLGPRDGLEAQLVRLVEEVLDVSPVGVGDGFFELGGHSLLAVRLLSRIQETFGRELPLSSFFEAPTVEGLAARLRDAPEALRSSSGDLPDFLVQLSSGTSEETLFCFHPVSGSVFCYADLVRKLPHLTLYGLRVPEVGEPLIESLKETARHYARAIRAIREDGGPLRLLGWSVGGLLAYETARQLRAQGLEVAPPVLVDARLSGNRNALEDPSFQAAWFARDVAATLGREVSVEPEEFRGLSDEEQAERLLELARRHRLLPPGTDPRTVLRRLQVFRDLSTAARRYQPGSFDGSVVFVGPAEDVQSAAAPWRDLAAGGVDVRTLPGDHYSLLREPAVEGLARILIPNEAS